MSNKRNLSGQFKFIGGNAGLDFANTINYASANYPNERLNSFADIVTWGLDAECLTDEEATTLLVLADGNPPGAEATLELARDLRLSIHHIFYALAHGYTPDPGDLTTLNTALGNALAHLSVARRDTGFAWMWATSPHQERVLWPVAQAAADLLVSGNLARVNVCESDACSWLFVDASKNQSRRWCSMRDCGNRDKVQRYYHRHKDS